MLSSSSIPQNKYKIVAGQSRISTDRICTVIGALFAIVMFVTANIMWDGNSFHRHFSGYYDDNNGGLCNGTALFIQNPDDASTGQCVTICPDGYFNQANLCLPNNDDQLQNYMNNPQISVIIVGKAFKWVLLYTAIIALSFGLIRLVYVNCFPRTSVQIDFFATILLLIGIGILLLSLYDVFLEGVTAWKIAIAISCFLLALIIAALVCMYRNELKIQGIFLDYAVQFLNEHTHIYLYIPIFLCLSVGLAALFVWQHCCFASRGSTSRNFFNFNSTGVWGVINILELIWAIQFLRDAFNFCIAGNVVDHYWKFPSNNENCFNSYQRLICYHWGSVTGGSFLNAFFEIPSMILNILRCNPGSCCEKAGAACSKYNILANLTDLVRTDVYSCINLKNLPYCQAAQQCKRICTASTMFAGYHSPMKHYRLTTHAMCVTAIFIIAWFIQRDQMQYYGMWNFALIIIVPLLLLTWFISIYSDTAQALQTSFLFERELQPNYEFMTGLHPSFKEDLQHRQRKIKKDGNC